MKLLAIFSVFCALTYLSAYWCLPAVANAKLISSFVGIPTLLQTSGSIPLDIPDLPGVSFELHHHEVQQPTKASENMTTSIAPPTQSHVADFALVDNQCYGSFAESVAGQFFKWEDRSMYILLGGVLFVLALPAACYFVYICCGNPAENSWDPIREELGLGKNLWITFLILCALLTSAVVWLSHALPRRATTCAHQAVVYEQMFCEATHRHEVVQHPANAWSNLPYLYFGIYLLLTAGRQLLEAEGLLGQSKLRSYNSFYKFDTLFGMMLVTLFTFSFSWDSSGCPNVHYYDLACMYSVIGAFPIRYIALASEGFFSKFWASSSPARLTRHYDLIFALTYAGIILALFAQARERHAIQPWSTTFPTGRSHSADLTPEFRWEIMGFVVVPIVFWTVLTASLRVRRQLGNIWCAVAAISVLVVSWFVHLSERWALDIYCCPSSWLQPTAAFHVLTGLTIAIAHAHVRSIDFHFPWNSLGKPHFPRTSKAEPPQQTPTEKVRRQDATATDGMMTRWRCRMLVAEQKLP